MKLKKVAIPAVLAVAPFLISVVLFVANKAFIIFYLRPALTQAGQDLHGPLISFCHFISRWGIIFIIASMAWFFLGCIITAFYALFLVVNEQKAEAHEKSKGGV